MKLLSVVPYLFVWHYTTALTHFLILWKDFFWFVTNYFSFKVLFRTLFAPYKRLTEKYKGGLDIGDFFESIVINTLMRFIGFGIRVIVISLGILALLGVFVIGLISLVVWLVLPFLLVFIFFTGLFAVFGKNKLTI